MLRKQVVNSPRTMDESTSPTAKGLEDKASSLGVRTGWLGHQGTARARQGATGHEHRLGGGGRPRAGLERACPVTPGPSSVSTGAGRRLVKPRARWKPSIPGQGKAPAGTQMWGAADAAQDTAGVGRVRLPPCRRVATVCR